MLPEQRPVLQRADGGMLVPAASHARALEVAKAAAEATAVGPPGQEGVAIGPVVSKVQYDKIQALIAKGVEEGAELVTGGTDRPEGMESGYYVRPTVFGGVSNDMTIAQEEIFGPVLSILPYETEEEAIRIANDTPYGLSSYVPVRRPRPCSQRRLPHPRRQRPHSTAPPPTSAPPSAATSSPATAASGATSASRSSWRSRP